MAKSKRWSTGQKLLLLGFIDLTFTVLTFMPRKAKARRRPKAVPDVRAFRSAVGEGAIMPYLAEAERVSQIPGLANFGRALAWSRSRFDNKHVNRGRSMEACQAYLELRELVFVDNPYAEPQWCWGSGGWYDFIPAEALANSTFAGRDPKLVFDPSASTAMLAELVHAIIDEYFPSLPPDQRTWLAIRRGLEGPDVILDFEESSPTSGSAAVRADFAVELERAAVDPSFASHLVSPGPYPGTTAVWHALSELPVPNQG